MLNGRSVIECIIISISITSPARVYLDNTIWKTMVRLVHIMLAEVCACDAHFLCITNISLVLQFQCIGITFESVLDLKR